MREESSDIFGEASPEPANHEFRYLVDECVMCGQRGLYKCMETRRIVCLVCGDVNYSRIDTRLFFYQQGCRYIRLNK